MLPGLSQSNTQGHDERVDAMGKLTMIKTEKQVASAKTEIAKMAGEAAARANSMINELTLSLKAEAERSLSEFRQSVSGSQEPASVDEENVSAPEPSSAHQQDVDQFPAMED